MYEKTYAILSLLDIQHEVRGRKKIQKIFYLLKHLGYSVPFKFSYHFYGPYSSDLQGELSYRADKDAEWQPWEEASDDTAYTYRTAENSESIKNALEADWGYHPLSYSKELIQMLNEKDANLLELTSTYAYFLDSEHSPEKAKERTKEMKPKLLGSLNEAIILYSEITDRFSNRAVPL